MKNIVFAIYTLRMKKDDNHNDRLSNAIFFTSLFSMLALFISVVFFVRVLGLDIDLKIIDDYTGIGGGKVIGFIIFCFIWLYLKLKFRNMTMIEIEKLIDNSNWLTNNPTLIAFSPLIIIFILLMLILIV